jgi:hypothetical protein
MGYEPDTCLRLTYLTPSVPQTSTTLKPSILEGPNLVKTLNNFAQFSDQFSLYLQIYEYINI